QPRSHPLERAVMRTAAWLLDHPSAYALARQGATRTRGLRLAELPLPGPARTWRNTREIPRLPDVPFRTWWKKRPAGDGPDTQPAGEDTRR
ncbi:lactate utilisation protein LutB domain-containing protein, partial [Actinacidiphila acidipaludis]